MCDMERINRNSHDRAGTDELHRAFSRVLLIGDLAPEGFDFDPEMTATIATVAELDADYIARTHPDLALSPLVGAGFDCFDVAEKLTAAGFSGRYVAFVDTLPNPAAVRGEVQSMFPGLDFDLIVLS